MLLEIFLCPQLSPYTGNSPHAATELFHSTQVLCQMWCVAMVETLEQSSQRSCVRLY